MDKDMKPAPAHEDKKSSMRLLLGELIQVIKVRPSEHLAAIALSYP